MGQEPLTQRMEDIYKRPLTQRMEDMYKRPLTRRRFPRFNVVGSFSGDELRIFFKDSQCMNDMNGEISVPGFVR